MRGQARPNKNTKQKRQKRQKAEKKQQLVLEARKAHWPLANATTTREPRRDSNETSIISDETDEQRGLAMTGRDAAGRRQSESRVKRRA
jgi:hypothetical protein